MQTDPFARFKKYAAEFIGTFAIVFFGTGSIIINHASGGVIGHAGVATVFGLTVMIMIFAFGELSGAHFNPAVTIGFATSGRIHSSFVIPYLLSQLTGGIAASLVLNLLFPGNDSPVVTVPHGSIMQSFILEVILTFFLMLVIFNVSRGSKETGIMAGIAIGATVLIEAMFAGPVSGASMNPARSIGPAISTGNYYCLWLYIAAPIAGAIVASLLNSAMDVKGKIDNLN